MRVTITEQARINGFLDDIGLSLPDAFLFLLQRYQDDRLPKTARIVMANRAQGPDHVMQVFEERAPEGFKQVHDVASQAELEDIARGYKQIVGLDIETVNARAESLGLV